MQKKYNHHSIDEYMPIFLLFLVSSLAIIVIAMIVGQSFLEKTVFFMFGSFSIIGITRTYLEAKNTLVEINDNGLLFCGWKKRFFSTWCEVREVKIMTPIQKIQRYKIYTDKGSFLISMIETVDSPNHSPWEGTNREAQKATDELIEEIKKRSPYVKLTYSIWNRPL